MPVSIFSARPIQGTKDTLISCAYVSIKLFKFLPLTVVAVAKTAICLLMVIATAGFTAGSMAISGTLICALIVSIATAVMVLQAITIALHLP
ncbi:hypothetical protein D3C73_420560 [compost metagenome]